MLAVVDFEIVCRIWRCWGFDGDNVLVYCTLLIVCRMFEICLAV